MSDGIVDAVDEGHEARQGVEILEGDILVEVFAGESPALESTIMTQSLIRRAIWTAAQVEVVEEGRGRSPSSGRRSVGRGR